MSNITKKDVQKVAKLSALQIDDDKQEPLAAQLNDIISWVEKLNEVDTKDVEILTNVHNITIPLAKDEVSDGGVTEQVLKNAPDAKYNYFTVPKVL
jgi:aspartyl-tRNA(Asn)/glutamyl-tRNA(Gln) amidotransferase subunit C